MENLESLQHYINIEYVPKSWFACYQNALNQFQRNWLLNFDFKSICHFYNLSNNFTDSLLETVELLKFDNNLNFICYLFYYILYFSNESHDIWSWDFKTVFTTQGNYMIPAISLLAGQPLHIKNMKERNYDEYQIEKHKQNLYYNIMNDYNSIHGIRFRHMVWLSTFIKCNIIEIGRLQYNYHPFVDLDYLDSKKHSIELHIPGGRPLNIVEVKQSIKTAQKYIYPYFQLDYSKKLEFYVVSWLFSPELKYFLKEDSNILHFQKLFDIIEYHENLKDFMIFVFNTHNIPEDLSTLKCNTSLQNNMKSYLLEGNKLHIGTAILNRTEQIDLLS